MDASRRTPGRAAGLHSLAIALSGALAPDEVARIVAARGLALAGARIGKVSRVNHLGELRVVHRFGYPHGWVDSNFALERHAPSADAYRAGEPIWLHTRDEILGLYPELQATVEAIGAVAMAAIPVVVDGKSIAVIGFSFHTPRLFEREERALLVSIADLCALALERARLYQEAQEARARAEASAAAAAASLAERRRTQAALEASESMLRTVCELMPQMVWTSLTDGRVEWTNGRWAAYTGAELGMEASSWSEVFHADDFPILADSVRKAFATELPYEAEARILRRDGVYRWHLVRAMPVRDVEGKLVRWVGTATDIHDQKLAQEEAVRLLDFQQQLTGMITHDIRSPLSAILTTVGLLLRKPHDAHDGQAFARILRGGTRIEEIVRVLLDFTHLQIGQGIPLNPRETDLCGLIREAAEAYPDVEAACSGSLAGLWDPARIQQVLFHLLENAEKHGRPGARIVLRCAGDEDSVTISVHNDGPPIPPALLDAIFEPFSRGRQTEETVKISLGLGLYIVRGIVEAHGGTVSVYSTAEEGTTFTVRLPRLRAGLPERNVS